MKLSKAVQNAVLMNIIARDGGTGPLGNNPFGKLAVSIFFLDSAIQSVSNPSHQEALKRIKTEIIAEGVRTNG